MKAFSSSLFACAAALTTIVVVATPAAAQPVVSGAACEIDQSKPQSVTRATLSLARATEAMKKGDATKDLKDIIAILNAPKAKNENPIGRAYLLGSAYVLLLEQPSIQPVSLRSAVGLVTDPSGTIDLFAAADSAITIVEQTSPGCASYMAPFRQQKAWLNTTNAAINALNANKLDSAEIYARRSLTLDRKSPYAYSVLAGVAKGRKNYPAMLEYAKQTITATGTDTIYADVRDRMVFDIAATSTVRADAATAAEKKGLAREAIAAWNNVLAGKTDDVQGTTSVTQLARLYVTAGDSINIPRIYAPMIANPAQYGEGALLQAGVVASHFKRPGDAAKLFAVVAERNPYQRDALNNLAASYLLTDQLDKVTPIVDKLVALDPSNPDNWMLYAFTYAGLQKNARTAKLRTAYTDSLVFYNNKADKIAAKVSFTEFSRNTDGTVLVGTIENKGTAARTYTLSLEFLGPRGEVVHSEAVAVGPVVPKTTKQFRVTNTKTGVAGYRYKPIT